MTNTFIKPSIIAARALPTLYANSVMLPLVWKDFSSDFDGAVGDTVTIRKPATFTANTYNQAVGTVKQDATETSTTVTLDTLKDVTVPITSYDRTLNVDGVQERIIQPAMEAHAQAIDTAIIAAMAAASWGSTVTCLPFNASSYPHPTYDLLKARRALNLKNVGMTGRVAVVDPFIYAQWAQDELSNRANERADAGTALRDAELGFMHGFDTFESNNIVGSNSYKGWAYHPTAIAFVSKPLALMEGAPNMARKSYKGLTLRVNYDYDQQYKQDVLSIDILWGIKVLDTNRGCFLNGNADS